MNLMSNARLFQDDGKKKNDLMFDMLPQVKFNMMGQIQIQTESKKPRSSASPYSSSSPPSSPSSPPPNIPGTASPLLLDTKLKEGTDPMRYASGHRQHWSDLQPSKDRDAPLDFSNKKQKFEKSFLTADQDKEAGKQRRNGGKKERRNSQEDNSSDEPDSPCSRLRNILKMKSPGSPVFSKDFEGGTVLNLSKDISPDQIWIQGRNASSIPHNTSSSSSSPLGMDMNTYSPGPNSGSQNHPFPFSSSVTHSLGLSPYGAFTPKLSPGMAQQSASSPLEPSNSPMFSSIPAASVSSTFASLSHPPQGSTLGPSGMGKSRVTRPFKAYPKDPLTFPTVGLYGLPVVGPTPSVSDALIHQQSNHAYAEFRKQMLHQSNTSRTKRMGNSKGFQGQEPLSDSTTSSTNPMDFGLGGGAEVTGTGSGPEDCLSTSDDGYGIGTHSHSKTRLKSDEQLKDEAYWERRRKNNEAAKRSRDARRAKEDEIAIRAAFLEQENLKLRFEVCALKNETAKLRCMLYKTQ